MSVITDTLTQLEAEANALESRIVAKVADAEKKSAADVPTADEVARLTQLVEKLKGFAV